MLQERYGIFTFVLHVCYEDIASDGGDVAEAVVETDYTSFYNNRAAVSEQSVKPG